MKVYVVRCIYPGLEYIDSVYASEEEADKCASHDMYLVVHEWEVQ